MKIKFLLAAVAVTFSLAMTSCGGNKAANADAAADTAMMEVVEPAEAAATCCKVDSTSCDSTKACTEKKGECTKDKKECCKEKAACDKK